MSTLNEKEIAETEVLVPVSDGTSMKAYMVRPAQSSGAKLPALMVFQEIFGVNDHIRDVTRRLAAQGYVAIAPDLFHRTVAGYQASYTQMAEAMKHMQAYSFAHMETDARACYDWLSSDADVDANRIGAIGFCLGGRMGFVANSVLPLKATVSFYGGRIPQDRVSAQKGPLLFFWGGLDKHIPLENVRALEDALQATKKDFVGVNFARADHGFFCDQRASYHASSARQAWALTLAFFNEHF